VNELTIAKEEEKFESQELLTPRLILQNQSSQGNSTPGHMMTEEFKPYKEEDEYIPGSPKHDQFMSLANSMAGSGRRGMIINRNHEADPVQAGDDNEEGKSRFD